MPPEKQNIPAGPLSVGFCRVDITAFVPDIGMMGYAVPTHRTQGVGAPLYARAMVLGTSADDITGIVCCDLWGITPSLRTGVIEQLKERNIPIAPSRLLITGTHTHRPATLEALTSRPQ